MCFDNDNDNDYDVIRCEIWQRSEEVLTAPARCIECRRTIAAGETAHVVDWQEHADCQICQDDCSDRFAETQSPQTCAHDYGFRNIDHTCRECELILMAIEDLEEREGCPAHARRPNPHTLWEELHNHDDAPKYAAHAIGKFPELATHTRLLEVI